MQINEYKRQIYLKDKIAKLKNQATNLFNKLNKESNVPQMSYAFNQQTDELSRLIIDIIYFIEISNKFSFLEKKEYNYQRQTPEERAMEEKESLIRKREATKHSLSIIEEAINEIKDNSRFIRLLNKLDMEKLRTTLALDRINAELRVYEGEPDLTDGEINIYITQTNGLCFKGEIFLASTPVCIGNIEYRGPDNSQWLGDIGYSIYPPFQGHNYAYKALELIREKIMNMGIDNVVITTNIENIPSKKTIEKFGGVLIEGANNDILRYTCTIKPVLEQSSSIKK